MRRWIPLLPLAGLSVLSALSARPADAQLRMFATREVGVGNLSDWPEAAHNTGLAAGNSICANLADLAGFDEPKNFHAWLSDDATDAYCNVLGLSGKIADECGQPALPDGGPWVRTDGRPFAHSLGELVDDRAVLYVPHFDQLGDLIKDASGSFFTGTFANGAASGDDCADWTIGTSARATIGNLHAGAGGWTDFFTSSNACATASRLFCFESGTPVGLTAFGRPGAWAFVTSTSGVGDLDEWPDSNGEFGIFAGDEICRAAARRGRLPAPDSYLAWLSDPDTDAIDRLVIDGPWRRQDGVEVAASKSELTSLPHASTFELDELGNHLEVDLYTGTGEDGRVTGSDCGGWFFDALETGTRGVSSQAVRAWTDQGFSSCEQAFHLLCFSNQIVLFADGFERHGTFEWTVTAD
jgi:hypothetical protein